MGILCDIPLPGLMEQEAPGDVVMRLGKPEPLEPINPDTRFCLQFRPGDAYFYYYKMGRCRIHQGREIVGEPVPGSDVRVLGGLAETLGISILLHQRGHVTLHASCVNLGSGAVAFLGDSEAGKSFIAAGLHSRGHAVMADDVTVVDVQDSGSLVYPGIPALQLLPDAAEHFGYAVEGPQELDSLQEKVIRRFPGQLPHEAVRLNRLYILEEGPSIRVEPVGRHRAVFELVRHSYWIQLIHDARPASYFLQCARLCERVPVLRLIRPLCASAMSDVIVMVEEDLLQDTSSIGER